MRFFLQTKDQRRSWPEYGLFVSAAVFVVLSYFYFFTPISVEVVLSGLPQRDVETRKNCPYPDMMQLFYARGNKGYGEKRSQHFRLTADKTRYRFIVGNYKFVDSLKFGHRFRFDPMMHGGDFHLREIVIHQPGYRPIRINKETGFQLLRPLHDIGTIKTDRQGMVIHSTGCDPQLEIEIAPGDVSLDYPFLFRVMGLTVAAASLLYLVLTFSCGTVDYALVPCLMAFVLALVFSMAALNKGIIHSDEVVHFKAGHYYEQHWLPPKICAPETKDTYSCFGVSRLDSFEIAYFFAGKFARFLSLSGIDDLHRIRYFNVLLFLILALLSAQFIGMRLMAMALLISPQVWYLFSYCNSDSFALFVIALLGYQVMERNSMTNRFLSEPIRSRTDMFRAVLVCLLFSLLLLLKVNYYVFIVFLILVLLYRLAGKQYDNPGLTLRRVVVIALVAAALFGLRWGVDISQNGLHRSQRRQECREMRAEHFFNPTTPLAKRYPFLRLKERQVPLRDLFEKHNWGIKTFVHFFGVYFTTPQAEIGFFKFFMAAVASFALWIIGSILQHRQWRHLLLLAIVLFCSGLLVSLSLWNSWVASFQAQGRYLFPVLIMTAVLIAEMRSYLNGKILSGFVLLFFFVSVYSFVFIGMRQLLCA